MLQLPNKKRSSKDLPSSLKRLITLSLVGFFWAKLIYVMLCDLSQSISDRGLSLHHKGQSREKHRISNSNSKPGKNKCVTMKHPRFQAKGLKIQITQGKRMFNLYKVFIFLITGVIY